MFVGTNASNINPTRDLYRFRGLKATETGITIKARPPLGDEAVLQGSAAGGTAAAMCVRLFVKKLSIYALFHAFHALAR